MEREYQIIACAALFPFFKEKSAEVAAIAVSPECRGEGQGDKLLGMILDLTFTVGMGCLNFLNSCAFLDLVAFSPILNNHLI